MDDPGIDLDPDGEIRIDPQFTSFTALLDVGHSNSREQDVCHEPIDWESVLLSPITEDQIGTAHPVMDEDAVYEFVGLRAEDERAEQARAAARKVAEIDLDNVEKQDAYLLVHDTVPGEDSVFFDKDDPPMGVGTVYSSMNEFRDAVRQHAIKRQFKLDTKKSRPDYFHAKCAHEECSWSISARQIHGDQQVRVAVNKGKHFCPSTKELITKITSYKWVRDKAVPILRKDPNIPATKLKKELFEQHQVTIGYPTVHLGKEMARQELFGTWEESFGLLFNFAAEIEKRMPGSVGHRSNSPKCPLNGTKKRKSRAKKGKAGRPPGSSKGDATPSPSKRQKVVVEEGTSEINTSPGPVTRSQSQTGGEPSNTMTTPTKSPKYKISMKKKITPRKGRKKMLELDG